MASSHDHLRALAGEIGPRPAGGPGEEAAAGYIHGELRGQGLECHRQRFAGSAGLSWALLVISALTLSAAWLYRRRPGAGLFVALCAAVSYIAETNTHPLLSRLLPKRRSVNVVAKIHARSKELRRVLVVAHLDSHRTPKGHTARHNIWQNPAAIAAGLLAICLFYSAGLAVRAPLQAFLWFLSLPVSAIVFMIMLLPVVQELTGQPSPGANDNAAGLAVLLDTAKALGRAPLLTTSVWCVATGCGAEGHWGALALIREHRFAPGKTLIINVDAPGAGRLAALTREGAILPMGAGGILLEAAQASAAEKAISLDLRSCHSCSTDASPFLARRIPAVTITSYADRGRNADDPGAADPAASIDPANLVAARDLILGILRKLEE